MEWALLEGYRRVEVVALRRAPGELARTVVAEGRHTVVEAAVVVEDGYTAVVGEDRHTAAVDIGLEVELRMAAVEAEDILAVVGTGCVKEPRMAVAAMEELHRVAAAVEGILAAVGVDRGEECHMEAAAVGDGPDCSGLEVDILPEFGVEQASHHNSVAVDSLVADIPEGDIGQVEAAGILLQGR